MVYGESLEKYCKDSRSRHLPSINNNNTPRLNYRAPETTPLLHQPLTTLHWVSEATVAELNSNTLSTKYTSIPHLARLHLLHRLLKPLLRELELLNHGPDVHPGCELQHVLVGSA